MPVPVRDGENRDTEPAEIPGPTASWLTPGRVTTGKIMAVQDGKETSGRLCAFLPTLLPALLWARTPARDGEEHRKHLQWARQVSS